MKSATSVSVPHSSSRFEGFCMDILRGLQGILKFEYKVYLKTEIGRQLKNGSWSGLIGELTHGVRNYSKCYFHLLKHPSLISGQQLTAIETVNSFLSHRKFQASHVCLFFSSLNRMRQW